MVVLGGRPGWKPLASGMIWTHVAAILGLPAADLEERYQQIAAAHNVQEQAAATA
jgi:hypothetical protein